MERFVFPIAFLVIGTVLFPAAWDFPIFLEKKEHPSDDAPFDRQALSPVYFSLIICHRF